MLDLTNAIRQRISRNEKSICEKCSHKRVCRAIDNQPCFECNQFAEEVVRCKDCKMRCPESVCIAKHCTLTGIPVDDDDFCSYGERKDNE